MNFKLFLLTLLFALLYRPTNGTRAWSFFAAYDTRREAIHETQGFGKGGDYEFKIVPMFAGGTL